MAHGDPHEKDGGVSFYEADAARLQSYTQAEKQLSPFKAPMFIHADNLHERFVACGEGADFVLRGARGAGTVESTTT